MAVFVYTETDKNGFTPISLEAISFAKKIASQKKEELIAVCINTENPEFLQKFGTNKIISIHSDSLTTFNAQCYAQVLAKHINGLTIFPHTIESQAISGVLSILKKSSLITQVNSYPECLSPFILKKNIFSGKAEMNIYPDTENLILTIMPYVFNIKEIHEIAFIESYHIEIDNPFKLIHKEEKNSKKDLTTSDIVVCAGRGLKSPENWKIVEELAEILNGATACSRPVSDMGWRDYNEHTGQTGKHISPKLYIGIGISGATQHIAGIINSKTIIVINNDSNADFFKYADYGIIGDAFKIVPSLTKKIREFKNKSSY